LDYIDLYLMHMPVGYKYVDDNTLLPKNEDDVLQLSDVDYLDTYKAMEKLVKLGLVRSIGVSNFNSEQLARVLVEIGRIYMTIAHINRMFHSGFAFVVLRLQIENIKFIINLSPF